MAEHRVLLAGADERDLTQLAEYQAIGGYRWVLFMTEDVHAKYKEWSERGVHFLTAPETPGWGGTYARFEDPDGNAFGLEGFDEVKQSLELRRQAHEPHLRRVRTRFLDGLRPEDVSIAATVVAQVLDNLERSLTGS